jgi:hypothetical protein
MQTVDLLPDTTRLWIYQSNRPFTATEIAELKPSLSRFATQWVSHSQNLQSFAEVYHERFIVLMVDESQAGASGCSIDASVRFLKLVENEYGVDLFDRMRFSFKLDGEIHTVPRDEFAKLYAEGKINDDTLVFDTLINTKKAFEDNFVKRLGESWHKRMV